jgi:hypothetical protein
MIRASGAQLGRRRDERAPPKPEADDRNTWITLTFSGGRTIRYWGDPDEPIDWDEFDFDPDEEHEPDDDPN